MQAHRKELPKKVKRVRGKRRASEQSLVPFSANKALVPGKGPGADREFSFWRKERQIDTLRQDKKELYDAILRLSREIIDVTLYLEVCLRTGRQEGPENLQRRISQLKGSLKRQKGLLDNLLAEGFDLHPLLSAMWQGASKRMLKERR